MKKRIFAILLSAVFAVTLLAACGNSGGGNAPATTAAPAATEAAPAATEAAPAATEAAPGATGGDWGEYTADNPLELTISTFVPNEENQMYRLGANFKERIEAATGGAVKVDVLLNGVADQQSLEQVIAGTLTMAVNNTPIMSQFYDLMQIVDLPYLFRDWDHIYAFMDSDICANIKEEFGKKTGARMLCFRGVGYRNLESQVGFMKSPADTAKIKTRCTNSTVFTKTWEAWGANVQTFSAGEVMAALQNGTIDSCDNVNNVAVSEGFYQVCPYITVMEYAVHFNGLTINNALYESLTPDLQAAIDAAAVAAGIEETQYLEATADEYLQKMLDSEYGCEAYELTQAEKDVFREAAQPAYDWAAEKFGQDKIDAIAALGK